MAVVLPERHSFPSCALASGQSGIPDSPSHELPTQSDALELPAQGADEGALEDLMAACSVADRLSPIGTATGVLQPSSCTLRVQTSICFRVVSPSLFKSSPTGNASMYFTTIYMIASGQVLVMLYTLVGHFSMLCHPLRWAACP